MISSHWPRLGLGRKPMASKTLIGRDDSAMTEMRSSCSYSNTGQRPRPVDRHRADLASLDAQMRQLAAKKGAEYISLVPLAICGKGSCGHPGRSDIPCSSTSPI